MTPQEVEATALSMRRAFLRTDAIERLLRAAEKDLESGTLPKGLEQGTKKGIWGLKHYLKAAKDQGLAELEKLGQAFVEAGKAEAIDQYNARLAERNSVPDSPPRNRKPKTGEARVTRKRPIESPTVKKRKYSS